MTERFFYLLTEDGEVLLSEDGQPFFGVEIIEEEVKAGGRKLKRGKPVTFRVDSIVTNEPDRDWEEEEALLTTVGVMTGLLFPRLFSDVPA